MSDGGSEGESATLSGSGPPGERELGITMSTEQHLLNDEASIVDLDELKPLIAEGQEKGVLTFEQIALALEEVEVTKEQVQELHSYLDEQGIDVVGADGRAATSEAAKVEAAVEAQIGRASCRERV